MIIYRASELGSCVRALVARRRGESENDTPEVVQGWFDRGIAHEDECIAAMQAEGYIIDSQQREVTIQVADDVAVVGHLDGRVTNSNPRPRTLEIKAPYSWAKWYDAHLNNDYSDPLMSRYGWQSSSYCVAEESEMIVACLDGGVVKMFTIEIPPYSIEDIRKRVLSIEFMVETGVWPECDQRMFLCPFFPRVCTHKQDEVAFDPVVDEYAMQYQAFKAMEKAAKEDADRYREKIMAHLGERESVVTSQYKVTRVVTKGGPVHFERKPGVSLKVTKRGDGDE